MFRVRVRVRVRVKVGTSDQSRTGIEMNATRGYVRGWISHFKATTSLSYPMPCPSLYSSTLTLLVMFC